MIFTLTTHSNLQYITKFCHSIMRLAGYYKVYNSFGSNHVIICIAQLIGCCCQGRSTKFWALGTNHLAGPPYQIP